MIDLSIAANIDFALAKDDLVHAQSTYCEFALMFKLEGLNRNLPAARNYYSAIQGIADQYNAPFCPAFLNVLSFATTGKLYM